MKRREPAPPPSGPPEPAAPPPLVEPEAKLPIEDVHALIVRVEVTLRDPQNKIRGRGLTRARFPWFESDWGLTVPEFLAKIKSGEIKPIE